MDVDKMEFNKGGYHGENSEECFWHNVADDNLFLYGISAYRR